MNKLIIYSDGGARGNPGPAAIGVAMYASSGDELKRISEYIGETTNNQAEYKALIRGLIAAKELGGIESVVCHLDSELVVKQLQGLYKVKEKTLMPLVAEALRLTANFKQIQFIHVPREKNKLADQLVNEALDKAGF